MLNDILKSDSNNENNKTNTILPSNNSLSEEVEEIQRQLTEPLLEDNNNDMIDGIERTNSSPSSSSEQQHVSVTKTFMFTVFLAVIPMFLYGYNIGVLNAPERVMFPGHTRGEWSAAVSVFCLGGVCGARLAGRVANMIGRRSSLLLFGGVLSILGGVTQMMAPSMGILIVGRIVVGWCGGAATVLTPMYLAEISPLSIRGTIGTLTQLATVLGILLSALMAEPFTTKDLWRIIFAPVPLLSLLFSLIGVCCLYESPRWLLLKNNSTSMHQAKTILRIFFDDNTTYTSEDDENNNNSTIEQMIRDATTSSNTSIEEGDQENEEENDITPQPSSTSFRTYWTDPQNRIPILSSFFFVIAQQLSGINAVFYYSTSFLSGVIENSQTVTLLAFTVNAIATIPAVFFMDRFGRKTLLMVSSGGMCICSVVLTLSRLGLLPSIVTVVAVMAYIIFFELGLGCIPFFLPNELIAPQFLGQIQSIAMTTNWIANFLIGMGFPYLDEALEAYSFVPFAIALLITFLYALLFFPETRNKTLAQIQLELLHGRRQQHHELISSSEDAVMT